MPRESGASSIPETAVLKPISRAYWVAPSRLRQGFGAAMNFKGAPEGDDIGVLASASPPSLR